MYVCVCSAVTDHQIRTAVESGAQTLTDLQSKLPVAVCCGQCADTARRVVDECLRERIRPCAS
jgi:bacterioferritin-associated ferredoxin